MQAKSKFLLFIALSGLFLQSCSAKPVEKAFAGKMDKIEETKTIVEYCQSCHLHRNFDKDLHLAKMTMEYKAEPYRSAESCRTCHTLKRNFWNDPIRGTLFPEGRLVNE